jgi:hypothetical protein
MSAVYADLASMLSAHGIKSREVPFVHDGYSGATMGRIEQDGRRYVIKRVSRTKDWIIQMTSDHAMREAQIAASGVLGPLAPGLRSPSIGAARDGDGFALLMHDLTDRLLPPRGLLPSETFDLILARVAQMHATFWNAPPGADIGWCGMRERVLFLSEQNGERLRDEGLMEFGFAAEWERFHATVPRDVSDLVRGLHADPAPLLAVLETLPPTLVHNDVKTGNIAMEGDTVWLFDWALAGIGPACSDLGWLLAVNSSRLPWSPDETEARYAQHLQSALGNRFDAGPWERQRAAAHLVGLLLLGWGKLDDPRELDWWCTRALEAKKVLNV